MRIRGRTSQERGRRALVWRVSQLIFQLGRSYRVHHRDFHDRDLRVVWCRVRWVTLAQGSCWRIELILDFCCFLRTHTLADLAIVGHSFFSYHLIVILTDAGVVKIPSLRAFVEAIWAHNSILNVFYLSPAVAHGTVRYGWDLGISPFHNLLSPSLILGYRRRLATLRVLILMILGRLKELEWFLLFEFLDSPLELLVLVLVTLSDHFPNERVLALNQLFVH